MQIVSRRPFAPKIPVSSWEGEGESRSETSLFGILAILISFFGALALIFGGVDGVIRSLISIAVLVVAPITAALISSMMFQAMDCIDDFTRFSSKAVGLGTLFLAISIVFI